METNNNQQTISREELLTNNEKQDLLLNQAAVITEDGRGGLEGFVSQYNKDCLLLGCYTPAEKVAEIFGLKNMKQYTQEADPNNAGELNYKYKRITDKGAIKVKASGFADWIAKENQKIYGENEIFTVSISKADKNFKYFNVNGTEVRVGNQGTWFFTNEAFVVAAFISQMSQADHIADQFLQYTKMMEIGNENAKVLSNVIDKAIDSGINFSEFLDKDELIELFRTKASVDNNEYTPKYYATMNDYAIQQIEEIESQIDEMEFKIRKEKNDLKKAKLKQELATMQFNLEAMLKLRITLQEELIFFKDMVKNDKNSPNFLIRDIVNDFKIDAKKDGTKTKYTNDSEAYTELIKLGMLEKNKNIYYPTKEFDWLYGNCGSFQKRGKSGCQTPRLNDFGFSVVYYALSLSEQIGTDKTKEELSNMGLDDFEALLYGEEARNNFWENKKAE